MKPSLNGIVRAALIAAAVAVPLAADAHRAWLLPSATVLSGKDPWVTVDAAISNDLFYFEHNAMALTDLAITAPDGSTVMARNQGTGRFRSTFDIHLAQPGTYRIAVAARGVFASYKVNGQPKRWRGTAARFAAEVPADAQDLNVVESVRRVESFVTAGRPTALQPIGVGLELVAETHPNDLVTNTPAVFRLLLDGKPAADVKIEVVRGGIRYRDKLHDTAFTTDKDGKVAITWQEPGMYWVEASMRDNKTTLKPAKERRATYIATLEVLPE
jgi:uncharacterized GH25 family protein